MMLLYIFVSSLLPYIEGIDSWLFEGTLDDPFEEVIILKLQKISQRSKQFLLLVLVILITF